MRLTLFQTGTMPCPYLEGKRESRVFAKLDRRTAKQAYDNLNRAGFRRSQAVVYRPHCPACDACVPVRIAANHFRFSRSFRRIIRRNGDIGVSMRTASATEEQYRLFKAYLDARHEDGDMAAMDWAEYRDMVEKSPVHSTIVEFRNPEGRLVAAKLVDCLDDGFSAVYSFFDPALEKRSLGTYTILWLVDFARRERLPYIYLGYWIADSPRMSYKARFQPLERYTQEGWVPLSRPQRTTRKEHE